MSLNVNLSDFFTLPTKIMIAIATGSGIVLFAPDSLIKKLYLFDFRNNFGFILGLIFIATFSISFISLIAVVYKYFKNKHMIKNFKKNANSMLKNLSPYQKSVIYLLYKQENNTFNLPLHDGAIAFLEHNLMIGKATGQYFVEDLNNANYPYLLHPWVIDELKKDIDLLSSFKNSFKSQNI